MLNTINTDTKYNQYRFFIIVMQHFSDCDGSAMLRISLKQVAIWNNSYQNPMQFDLFQSSSKFRLTWVGVHVPRVLSQITQKCCLLTCINRIDTLRVCRFGNFIPTFWCGCILHEMPILSLLTWIDLQIMSNLKYWSTFSHHSLND
jgi:hypothetical protein